MCVSVCVFLLDVWCVFHTCTSNQQICALKWMWMYIVMLGMCLQYSVLTHMCGDLCVCWHVCVCEVTGVCVWWRVYVCDDGCVCVCVVVVISDCLRLWSTHVWGETTAENVSVQRRRQKCSWRLSRYPEKSIQEAGPLPPPVVSFMSNQGFRSVMLQSNTLELSDEGSGGSVTAVIWKLKPLVGFISSNNLTNI